MDKLCDCSPVDIDGRKDTHSDNRGIPAGNPRAFSLASRSTHPLCSYCDSKHSWKHSRVLGSEEKSQVTKFKELLLRTLPDEFGNC